MLFLQTLANRIAEAINSKATVNLAEYKAPENGEKVIAVVEDPALLAVASVTDAIVQEFAKAWPKPPQNKAEEATALRAKAGVDLTSEIRWLELRRALGATEEENIGLRAQAGKLVLVELPVRNFTRDLLEAVMAEAALGDNPECRECDSVDCPQNRRYQRN